MASFYYGTNNPAGFQAARTISGSTWTGQTNQYIVQNNSATTPLSPSTTTGLFIGDPVSFVGAGTIVQYVPTTASIVGVFVGVEYTQPNGTLMYVNFISNNTPFMANTLPIANIIDDPHVIFQIQVNNSAALGATQPVIQGFFGNGYDISNSGAGLGNLPIGQSTFIVGTTANTAVTAAVHALRFVPTPDMNIYGPYVWIEVFINNHYYSAGTAGI